MKNLVLLISFIFIFLIYISYVDAINIQNNRTLTIQVLNASSHIIQNTEFIFLFNISNSENCNSNPLFSQQNTLTTDARGITFVNLSNINIDVNQQLYLCYTRYSNLGSFLKSEFMELTPNFYSLIAKNITRGANVTLGNVSLFSLTQASCDVKSTSSGNLYCGTDSVGSAFDSESANSTYAIRNASHITNTQISCKNITGGPDSDFCTDADTGGASTFNPVNVSYFNNTQRWTADQNFTNIRPHINNTYDLGGANNSWANLFVNTINVLTFTNKIAYSVLTLTNSIVTGDIVDRAITSIKIALNSITVDHLQANSVNNSAIADNSINGSKIQGYTINSSHIQNITCSQIKGGTDSDYCIDSTSSSSFSNAYSNLTALVNTDGYVLINITGSSSGINNQTLLINLSNNVIRWLYNHSSVWGYNQSNYSSQELTNAYSNLWRNESGSYSPVKFGYNMSVENFNNVYITSNLTNRGNTTLQNLTITDLKTCTLKTDSGGGLYCGTDLQSSGSFSNAISNLTGLTSSDGRINFSGSNEPRNNVSITLRLNDNVPFNVTFLNYDAFNYNQSNYSSVELQSSYKTFWINQTKSIIDDFARFWRNNTLDLLSMTNRWTAQQNFTAQILIQGNLNVTSNFTTQNLTITDLSTCTLKTNANGLVYCGTDSIGGQLDDVYNGTVKVILPSGVVNVSTPNPNLNETYTILVTNESGSYSPIRFGYNFTLADQFNYNQSNYSSQELHPSYSKFWINQTKSVQDDNSKWWYNQSLSTATSIFNKSSTNIFLNSLFDFLGLGLTTPSAKLHINISNNTGGTDALPDALLITKAGINYNATTLLIVNGTTGYLGIGTSSPSQWLDVRGIGNFSGTVYANNQTNLVTFSYNESSSYQQFWYNQTGNFGYNQSTGAINILESTYKTNWSRNYTTDTLNAFPICTGNDKITFNSLGVPICATDQTSSFNPTNLVYKNNTEEITNQWNFTNSTGASIRAVNWSNITIFRSQIQDNLANESSTYLQLNASTYAGINNESGSYAPIKFGYNFTLSDLFNYNETSSILGLTNTWTVQQTFNVNTIITNLTINNNLNVIGNITTNNLTVLGNIYGNLSCSQIKGGSDADFCADATGTGGSFSNAISNLTALVDVTKGINISADTDPNNNRTIFIRLNDTIRNFVSYNQTLAVVWNDLQNYPSACSAGTAVTTLADSPTCTAFVQTSSSPTWTGVHTFTPSASTSVWTFNSNITMNANLTFSNVQNGITWNTASRIYDNGSCLVIKGRTSNNYIC